MTDVCAILVNFKNDKKTTDCVRSLEKNTVKPVCVYVINNASTEASQKYFESLNFSIDVRWIWNKENRGFAAGCNQGIKAATAEHAGCYIWLLNNDTEATPHSKNSSKKRNPQTQESQDRSSKKQMENFQAVSASSIRNSHLCDARNHLANRALTM